MVLLLACAETAFDEDDRDPATIELLKIPDILVTDAPNAADDPDLSSVRGNFLLPVAGGDSGIPLRVVSTISGLHPLGALMTQVWLANLSGGGVFSFESSEEVVLDGSLDGNLKGNLKVHLDDLLAGKIDILVTELACFDFDAYPKIGDLFKRRFAAMDDMQDAESFEDTIERLSASWARALDGLVPELKFLSVVAEPSGIVFKAGDGADDYGKTFALSASQAALAARHSLDLGASADFSFDCSLRPWPGRSIGVDKEYNSVIASWRQVVSLGLLSRVSSYRTLEEFANPVVMLVSQAWYDGLPDEARDVLHKNLSGGFHNRMVVNLSLANQLDRLRALDAGVKISE